MAGRLIVVSATTIHQAHSIHVCYSAAKPAFTTSRSFLGLARFRDMASYLRSYLHICVFIRWRLCKNRTVLYQISFYEGLRLFLKESFRLFSAYEFFKPKAMSVAVCLAMNFPSATESQS